jgi:propanol-preferring alcohol dehydrogenase
MAKIKIVQVSKAGQLDQIERELPEPGINQVRIKVKACGVCHSDMFTRDVLWPNIQLPRVPGHEVAGVIDKIGIGVNHWKEGQRVGVGWVGAYCGQCVPCRRGDFITCQNLQISGIHFDGGYAEYMIAPVTALAAIPDTLTFEEAAPLLCAGVTTYNALRQSKARAGDLVAIQGIGGLGHLGIQFANKMGFKTVAISKGKEKEALAQKLGAHIYLNAENDDIAITLQKLGGARVILATAPSGKSISPLVKGLGSQGELMIVGASNDPIEVTAIQLIASKLTMRGFASGTAIDSEDTMNFCALTGIRPMIEKFPLEKVAQAYEHMITGRVRFRSVLLT